MRLKHFLVVAFMFVVGLATAQEMGQIPVDKNVRIGKLQNGLTYYIRHNDWPEHVANFYIAQRVGSIQENDDQRGLAHFLEHMAFNGSEHFPDSTLLEFTRGGLVEWPDPRRQRNRQGAWRHPSGVAATFVSLTAHFRACIAEALPGLKVWCPPAYRTDVGR